MLCGLQVVVLLGIVCHECPLEIFGWHLEALGIIGLIFNFEIILIISPR